ncbi:MAG: YjbH domain-containing protein, partial [Gammaproteobacteria bacterium]
SGGQSFKDKSFDAKFRIKKETEYLPAIAVGFRDLAGTGLFSSEFIVASKRYQNFDFTVGLGFGALSGGNRVSNPFAKINDRFLTRDLTSGEGGEFSIDAFFGGQAAIFGGIEYSLPFMHGSSLVLELDPVDYSQEGPAKITTAESDWNFAFKYPVSDAFHLRLGVTRGNNLNFAFSFSGFYKDSTKSVQKNDPPKPVEYDKAVRIVAGESHRLAYRAALHYLRERNISMHSGEIKQNTMEISYTQQRYFEHSRAVGRVIRILDQVSPDYIDTFRITNVNAGFPTHTVEVPRSRYKLYKDQKLTTPLLADSKIYRDRNIDLDDPFRPEVILPSYRVKFSPTYRSQIGGPDGFFFGDLSISAFMDILIKKNFNISSKVSVGLYNNYGELKLKS